MLPLTAAVPKEYAEKFDKNKPSNYASYEVATGPYMLKNNAEGKVLGIGYVPGKSATLVRNPNWNPTTDFRPAYLNEIDIKLGGSEPVIDRQVLEGDEHRAERAGAAVGREARRRTLQRPAGHLAGRGQPLHRRQQQGRPVRERRPAQGAVGGCSTARRSTRARGGELVSTVATHFIYPTIPGFEQAGGVTGLKVDYNEHPEGDMAVAEKYIKLAGYPSGKYTGTKTVQVVGASSPPEKEDAEIVNQTLKNLGFNTKLTLVEISTMYAKYCGVPKEEIDVCPNVGWIADFADPQTVLNITFNGKSIEPTGNVNYGQTDDPEDQRGDDRRRKTSSARKRGPRHGRRSTTNSSNRRRRSRSTGKRQPASRAKTCTGWPCSGTKAPGTTASPR